jgi:hypothetical protein
MLPLPEYTWVTSKRNGRVHEFVAGAVPKRTWCKVENQGGHVADNLSAPTTWWPNERSPCRMCWRMKHGLGSPQKPDPIVEDHKEENPTMIMILRYIVLAGESYTPLRWQDYKREFANPADAIQWGKDWVALQPYPEKYWFQVVDLMLKQVVVESA